MLLTYQEVRYGPILVTSDLIYSSYVFIHIVTVTVVYILPKISASSNKFV